MNPIQNELKEMVKAKGTGKTMGKNLSDDQLHRLPDLLHSADVSNITKATLITALLALPAETNEAIFVDALQANPSQFLDRELLFLCGDFSSISPQFQALAKDILSLIKGISLNEEQCKKDFPLIFLSETPGYFVAAFLEALRLKEETALENESCYQFLLANTHRIESRCDTVVDLSIGYDGFNRTPFLGVFVAPVLASLGIPTVIHGCDDIGPKHGVNPFKILMEAGYSIPQILEQAQQQIETTAIGWTYINQTMTCPILHALQNIRNLMVKRPLLSTLEKLLIPVVGQKKTAIVTSYTHPAYKSKMVGLMEFNPLISEYLLVRGVEGSIQLSLDRKTPFVTRGVPISAEGYLRPEDFNATTDIPESLEGSAAASLKIGTDALNGSAGWALESIVYLASAIATQVIGMPQAEKKVRNAIQSKNALHHWQQGISK